MKSKTSEPTLVLVGLGPGPVDLVTLGAWELLASGKPLKIRDSSHETAQTVLSRGISFEKVSGVDPASLAEEVLEWAGTSETAIYALPGNALEAPETQLILEQAEERGISVRLVPALSEIERLPAGDWLTRSHVAPEALRAGLAFQRLVSVMGRLRSPNGCPWDREQTHASLAVHLLEETYETLDAIDREDISELKEELGDLLLQVVFHSEMGREEGAFDAAGVIDVLLAKLVHRHPHIFGDVAVESAEEVVVNWERLKLQEKQRTRVDDGIPKTLPALLYAYKIQRRLARLGEKPPVTAERILELAKAAEAESGEESIGELLYAVVDLARRAGVDPESALRKRATKWPT